MNRHLTAATKIMSQLEAFETECNRWEAKSKETSDVMRIAAVQKGLDDEGVRTLARPKARTRT